MSPTQVRNFCIKVTYKSKRDEGIKGYRMDTQSLLINILILSILTASSILSEPVLILRKGVSIDKIEKLLLKFGGTVSLRSTHQSNSPTMQKMAQME